MMTNEQALVYVVEKANDKMKYYVDTKDSKHLDDAIVYIKTANIYITEINKEKKKDNYEV